ncbi:alpha/beta hydrolase [Streptomyces tateyamensis]|uniref:Alpha/beta hydrolase n=1 Tax=Streptomyces tateyamensis TaxID=565073 RepID=A0A2V4NB67_9ACTN|nr:alpha/beta fold hydrolase [Streptomyces tateyamensis]PYC78884.1 alpha/beta hydrolase [Streptomyces tateyamensis]
MARVRAGSLEVEYQETGAPDAPVLLLIAGIGAQLTSWPDEFCELLADRGYRVVRFDNRDCGLTSTLGRPTGYRLTDLAEDTVALLDALGVPAAHVVGSSMGGMVAQHLAIDHPDRVLSLCSIMSRPGDPSSGQPRPDVLAATSAPPSARPDEAAASVVWFQQLVGSPGYPVPVQELRAAAELAHRRAFRPEGSLRQLFAIHDAADRTAGLASVTVPTLVIHGEQDPLVGPSGGRATAAAVPGAELWLVPGMGHDLPRPLWPALTARIAANAARADQVHRAEAADLADRRPEAVSG